MTLAVEQNIADRIATLLNGESFPLSFTAERTYLPIVQLQDASDLSALVVARNIESDRLTRDSVEVFVEIDVAIVQQQSDTSVKALDPLALLAEQVGDFLENNWTHSIDDSWVELMNRRNGQLWSQDQLKADHKFQNVTTFRFRLERITEAYRT